MSSLPSDAKIIDLGYKPRPFQQALHKALRRFNVLVCHRRKGKTYFTIREIQDKAFQNNKKRPQYAYIAPTYSQAKKVAWEYCKDFYKDVPGVEFHVQELKVTVPHGDEKILIYLAGADNPDSLRGMYFDGVVIDEYAQISPTLWGEVVLPALSDREGWAIFIGTPKGNDHFKKIFNFAEEQMLKDPNSPWFAIRLKASQTGIIPEKELALLKESMSPEEYEQEMEVSFTAAMRGAYYDDYMVRAENENRITGVPYDASVPVHTAWDLGIGDSTAIWFYQLVGREVHLIDHLEMSGKGLEWYVGELKTKPYTYGTHFLPHDAGARELGTGKSLQEQLGDLIGGGHMITVLKRLKIEDGIQSVRALLSKCYFDKVKCYRGIECLKSYQKEWDAKNGIFQDKPKHDSYSHSSDAFRYLALSISKDVDRMNLPRDYYSKQAESQDSGQFWGF
jgi:hypothetical protein